MTAFPTVHCGAYSTIYVKLVKYEAYYLLNEIYYVLWGTKPGYRFYDLK